MEVVERLFVVVVDNEVQNSMDMDKPAEPRRNPAPAQIWHLDRDQLVDSLMRVMQLQDNNHWKAVEDDDDDMSLGDNALHDTVAAAVDSTMMPLVDE